MTLRKYEGFEVLERLETDLKKGARPLFDRCPWRTVFAHPAFLTAWYRSRPALHPILIASFGSDGALDAMVALARDEDRIVFAGGRDVPVHGWLAEPLRGSFAIERLLGALDRWDRLSFSPAPSAPIDWLSESRAFGRFARIEPVKRRVFRFDPARAKQKLDEKRNTSQLPHVKAIGPLSLSEARPEQLPLFVEWHAKKRHARGLQATLHNTRLDLYRTLDREILSATVLTAGDAVLSAMLVYRDGPRAWLELLAENPEHERHSPGILHLYLLEERWIGAVSELDVTADDDWMHLFAEEAEALSVELLAKKRDRIRRAAKDALRRIVSRR